MPDTPDDSLHGGDVLLEQRVDFIAELAPNVPRETILRVVIADEERRHRASLRSPTMPDTPDMDAAKPLDADELAYVRGQIETIRRYEQSAGRHAAPAEHTASRLLATLDTLTAAVRDLPMIRFTDEQDESAGDVVYRAAVLALLRGEQ